MLPVYGLPPGNLPLIRPCGATFPLGGRQRLSSGVAKSAILCCLMLKTVL